MTTHSAGPMALALALEHIRNVRARYCRLLDAGRWDEWTRLFSDDAHFSGWGEILTGEQQTRIHDDVVDKNTFVDAMRTSLSSATTVTQSHQPRIESHDADSIAATWPMLEIIDWGTHGQGPVLWFKGHYREQYSNGSEGWRIRAASRHMTPWHPATSGGTYPPDLLPEEHGALAPNWLPDTPPDVSLTTMLEVSRIRELKARYFRLLDTKRWVQWRALFTDELVVSVPGLELQTAEADRFVETVARAHAGTTTTHHGHDPEIRLVGRGRARGIWALNDFVARPPDQPRPSKVGYGHYAEEYEWDGARWKIANLRLSYLRIEASRQLPVGRPQLRHEPDVHDTSDEGRSSEKRLADLAAIHQLKARYTSLLDAKDWGAWRELFVDDATFSGTTFDGVGADRFVQGVSQHLASATTIQHVHMPEIRFRSEDTAMGIWAMEDQVKWRGTSDLPGGTGRTGAGYHIEEYRKSSGRWKIAALDFVRLRRDSG